MADLKAIKSSEWAEELSPMQRKCRDVDRAQKLDLVKGIAGGFGAWGAPIIAAIVIIQLIEAYKKAHPDPTAQQKFEKLIEQANKNAINGKNAAGTLKVLEEQEEHCNKRKEQLEKNVEELSSDLKDYKKKHGLEEAISTPGSEAFKDPVFVEKYQKLEKAESDLSTQQSNLKKIGESKEALNKTLANIKANNEAIAAKVEKVKQEAIVRQAIKEEQKKEELAGAIEMKEFKKKEEKKDASDKSESVNRIKAQRSDAQKLQAARAKAAQVSNKPNQLTDVAKIGKEILLNKLKSQMSVDDKFKARSKSYNKRRANSIIRMSEINSKNKPASKLAKQMERKFSEDYTEKSKEIYKEVSDSRKEFEEANSQLKQLKQDGVNENAIKNAEIKKQAALGKLDSALAKQSKLEEMLQAKEMQIQREEVLGEGETLGGLFEIKESEQVKKDSANLSNVNDEASNAKNEKYDKLDSRLDEIESKKENLNQSVTERLNEVSSSSDNDAVKLERIDALEKEFKEGIEEYNVSRQEIRDEINTDKKDERQDKKENRSEEHDEIDAKLHRDENTIGQASDVSKDIKKSEAERVEKDRALKREKADRDPLMKNNATPSSSMRPSGL